MLDDSIDLGTLLAIAGGGVVAVVIAIMVVVVLVRRGAATPAGPPWQPPQPQIPPLPCWQMLAGSLGELGMSVLDAECYWKSGFGSTLYVRFEKDDGSIWGWIDRAVKGGALDAFAGSRIEIRPRERVTAPLARFAMGSIEVHFGALPPQARLEIRAPEIPGAEYKLSLRTPLRSPVYFAALVRSLLALDEAAQQPLPEGVAPATNLPPAVRAWQAAAPLLRSLQMRAVNAELFTSSVDGVTLYLSLDVGAGTMRGWLERAASGGALDAALGSRFSFAPGHRGGAAVERLAAEAVLEPFSRMPRGARLSVKTPDIPGAPYELSIESPVVAPENPATLVTTLRALDEAVRRPSQAAGHAQLPPFVVAWQAAMPALGALGFRQINAELLTRSLDGGGTLYVSLDAQEGTASGRVSRAAPAGMIEMFRGASGALHPGAAGGNDLERFAASATWEPMSRLPRHARLSMTGPEIPGADYTFQLVSPVASPDVPPSIARALLALDEAARSERR